MDRTGGDTAMTQIDQAREELLQEFRRTVRERVERVTFSWITLERDSSNAELADGLLRELHTIKGEAKMMGFATLSRLAHRVEDMVLGARAQAFQVSGEYGDAILAAVDAMSSLAQEDGDDGSAETGLRHLFDHLAAFAKPRSEAKSPAIGAATPAAAPAPVDRVATTEAATAAAATTAVKVKQPVLAGDASLRVDADLVARFSEAASEAVVAHARYERAGDRLRALCQQMGGIAGSGAAASPRELLGAVEAEVGRLRALLQEGTVQARELEYRARLLRLVPISGLLAKYSRPARDLAKEHSKQVVVSIEHRGVSLDRHVVDVIAEPILHLVRNAVDHGIEAPEIREQRGKPREARLELSASQDGGTVLISVADDGAGINPAQVQQRAVAMGLLAEGAEPLTTQAAIAYLFRPGFSTRTTTTETSGRGVGLDVVKRQVERLGGSVHVTTTAGKGTRFELRVPLMVALTRVLVLRTRQACYALPSSAIEAVVEVDWSSLESVDGRAALRHRGSPVPLVDFSWVVEGTSVEQQRRAAIVSHDSARVAVTLGTELGEAEVLVKPLGMLLEHTRLFAGACILDQGDSALVLNPAQLLSRALGEQVVHQATEASTQTAAERILLVEDSAITRAMVARILLSFGYVIDEAADGVEALEAIGRTPVDLVLTDIDMPRMDGIALTQRLRNDPKSRNLPVIVLSTRGSDEDKRRALAAGADAYIVKTQFSEKILHDALKRKLRTLS